MNTTEKLINPCRSGLTRENTQGNLTWGHWMQCIYSRCLLLPVSISYNFTRMKSMQNLVKWNGELKHNKRWTWRKHFVCAGMCVGTTINNPHTLRFNAYAQIFVSQVLDSLPLWYLIANRKNDIKRNCCRKIKQENQLKGWNLFGGFWIRHSLSLLNSWQNKKGLGKKRIVS